MARVARLSWLALLGLACATTSPVAPAGGPAPAPAPAPLARAVTRPPTPVPATPESGYSTDAVERGVTGGPEAEALAAAVVRVLRERGDKPEPDGKLAAVAAWVLGEAVAERNPSSEATEAIARRGGFAGTMGVSLAFPVGNEGWRSVVSQFPRNIPINRYGVVVSAADRGASLVLGTVEVALEPFPIQLPVGKRLRLRGSISDRFARADVYVRAPDGKVWSRAVQGRKLDLLVKMESRGIYMVEIMGDGATGPTILINVPVFAGVAVPDVARPQQAPVAAQSAKLPDVEQGVLALLNRARGEIGLRPLASDTELRALALGHSRDMAAAHFVGHVSPTTGTFDDRARRSGLAVPMSGENVSQGESAQTVHEALMESPGHRANMLEPKYTHVGIGAALTPEQGASLVATLVFARRPAVPPAQLTASDLQRAIAALRRAKGLPVPAGDPILTAGAEAGIRAFASGAARTPERILAVSNEVVQQETVRKNLARGKGCALWLEIFEPDQLEAYPSLFERGLTRLGLAVAGKAADRSAALAVLVMTEGAACSKR